MGQSITVSLFGEESIAEAQIQALKQKNFKEKFLFLYIAQGCVNATKAAKEAGYSEKTAKVQASKLLADPQISFKILQEKEKLKTKLTLDAHQLAQEAYDFLQVGKGMVKIKNWKKDANGKITETEEMVYDGQKVAKALELLGRMTGIFSETRIIEDKTTLDTFGTTEELFASQQ